MANGNFGPVGDDAGGLVRFGAAFTARTMPGPAAAAGRIGFLPGQDAFHAAPGELVHTPRNQWHTLWNAEDQTARVLEAISPAGFEKCLAEIGPFFPAGAAPDLEGVTAVSEKYGLQMDFGSLPGLVERFGLARPVGVDQPFGTAP